MQRSRFIAFARRIWVPTFLVACGVFLWLHAEETLGDFTWPRLQNPAFIYLAIALQIATWWLLVTAWQRVLDCRLGKWTPFPPALAQFALFSLGKYLPGKIWGLVARASRMTQEGITAKTSVDATVYEQMIVLHSAAIVSVLFYACQFPGPVASTFVVLGVLSVIAGPMIYTSAMRLAGSAMALLHKDEPNAPPKIDAFRHISLIARYACAWVAHGLILACLYAAVLMEASGPEIAVIELLVLANTVGMLAGFLAFFAPAGFGVREAALAAILATGMEVQDAVVLSVLMRIWTIVADLTLGATAVVYRRSPV